MITLTLSESKQLIIIIKGNYYDIKIENEEIKKYCTLLQILNRSLSKKCTVIPSKKKKKTFYLHMQRRRGREK